MTPPAETMTTTPTCHACGEALAEAQYNADGSWFACQTQSCNARGLFQRWQAHPAAPSQEGSPTTRLWCTRCELHYDGVPPKHWCPRCDGERLPARSLPAAPAGAPRTHCTCGVPLQYDGEKLSRLCVSCMKLAACAPSPAVTREVDMSLAAVRRRWEETIAGGWPYPGTAADIQVLLDAALPAAAAPSPEGLDELVTELNHAAYAEGRLVGGALSRDVLNKDERATLYAAEKRRMAARAALLDRVAQRDAALNAALTSLDRVQREAVEGQRRDEERVAQQEAALNQQYGKWVIERERAERAEARVRVMMSEMHVRGSAYERTHPEVAARWIDAALDAARSTSGGDKR